MKFSRSTWIFILIAVVGAFVITRGLVARPTYTDAYYHFNSATQLANGHGFTDEYLWVYVGDPESLPAPSHIYWMPFTSVIASISMTIFNSTDYAVAQLPFTLMFAGTVLIAYWLGGYMGGTNRHGWVAGLLTLFGGFFVRWWGATDTFAPYALVGSLCLVFIGLAVQEQTNSQYRIRYWILAGLCAGFGHLTRADGILLLIVGWLVLIIPWGIVGIEMTHMPALNTRIRWTVVFTCGYLLVMTPWFIRNLDALGTPLPVGGTQAIWFTEYNDLFNYPPTATSEHFFADGVDLLISSRWTAFLNNLGTVIAVEGLIALCPLMLIGLWKRKRNAFFLAFILYALGLHIAMTLVFPFPGFRGGLFHSSSALVPWWMALGVIGLDDTVDWIAKYRRTWKPKTAKRVFSSALILLAVVLSFQFGLGQLSFSRSTGMPTMYRELLATVPEDARIMINDPSALYYFTGLGGVVTPNANPDVIPEIAQRYGVTYLLIEYRETSEGLVLAIPEQLAFDLNNPPDFLSELEFNVAGTRLYAINPE